MKFVRWVLTLAGLVVIAVLILRRLTGAEEQRATGRAPEWPPLETEPTAVPAVSGNGRAPLEATSEPAPLAVPPTPTEAGQPSWVEPDGDGQCPIAFPIKAKDASGIFHVPDGLSYGRTRADRCYVSEEAAVSDGYRAAKR